MDVGGISGSRTFLNNHGVNTENILSLPSSSKQEKLEILDRVDEKDTICSNNSSESCQGLSIASIPVLVATVKRQGGASTTNTNENPGIPKGLENLREVFYHYSHTCTLLTDAHKQRLQGLDVPTPQLDVLATKLTPTTLQALSQYFPKATDIKVACEKLSLETPKSIFKYFPRLQALDVTGAKLTDDHLQLISHQTQLKTLILSHNQQLSDSGLRLVGNSLKALERLDLRGCRGITANGFSSLGGLRQLRYLNLGYCGITSLDALVVLTRLEELHLSQTLLENARALGNFTNLKKLNIACCDELTLLPSLAGLVQLQDLTVYDSSRISNLGKVVGTLTHLKRLDIAMCNPHSIDFVRTLTELEELQLNDCQQIRDISALAELSNLKKLCLAGCSNISDLSPLMNLRGLQTIWLPDEQDHGVTSKAIRELQAALPGCRVVYTSLAEKHKEYEVANERERQRQKIEEEKHHSRGRVDDVNVDDIMASLYVEVEHQEQKEQKTEKTHVEEKSSGGKKRKVMPSLEAAQENEDYLFVEHESNEEQPAVS